MTKLNLVTRSSRLQRRVAVELPAVALLALLFHFAIPVPRRAQLLVQVVALNAPKLSLHLSLVGLHHLDHLVLSHQTALPILPHLEVSLLQGTMVLHRPSLLSEVQCLEDHRFLIPFFGHHPCSLALVNPDVSR